MTIEVAGSEPYTILYTTLRPPPTGEHTPPGSAIHVLGTSQDPAKELQLCEKTIGDACLKACFNVHVVKYLELFFFR